MVEMSALKVPESIASSPCAVPDCQVAEVLSKRSNHHTLAC